MKLKYDELLSNVAFKFNLRRYIAGEREAAEAEVKRLEDSAASFLAATQLTQVNDKESAASFASEGASEVARLTAALADATQKSQSMAGQIETFCVIRCYIVFDRSTCL